MDPSEIYIKSEIVENIVTCRTCLSEKDEHEMEEIFNIANVLKDIVPIQLERDDGMPAKICSTCLAQANQAYQFRTMCIHSDEILRDRLLHTFEEVNIPESSDLRKFTEEEEEIEEEEEEEEEENRNNCSVSEIASSDLLPKNSRHIYEKEFRNFEIWCSENNNVDDDLSETVLLAYFEMLSKAKKSSTLWSIYSMLRLCFKIYKNINISSYTKLQSFLKKLSQDYEPKRSKIFQVEDIDRFIREADDKMYLAMKVALIMGYLGALSRKELLNLLTDNVQFKNDAIIVSVAKMKNIAPRTFAIRNKLWIKLVKKYAKLRPTKITHKRFFITHRNGFCTTSPIGINTIGKMPKRIAHFLNLPNSELFSSHCFKLSNAAHLGGKSGLVTIKRHGGTSAAVKRGGEQGRVFSSQASTSNSVTRFGCKKEEKM